MCKRFLRGRSEAAEQSLDNALQLSDRSSDPAIADAVKVAK